MSKKTKEGNQVQKKPIWKKWWFWVIVVLVIGGIASVGGNNEGTEVSTKQTESGISANNNNESLESKEEETSVQENTTKSDKLQTETVDEKDNVSKEFQAALKSAQNYSDMMHMSKIGIYNQLISEYGEQFTEEEAQYAIDNVDADWNANALQKAKEYQETMNMSNDAIYDQLISEYGEQFTKEEAQYAIDNLE